MPGLSAVNEVTCQSRVSNMAGINTSPEWAERSLTQLCGKGIVSVVWHPGKRRLQEATSFVRVTWLVQVWKGTDSTRAPGGGHGNPLQYSCLENPKDRGAWQTTVHGVAKSRIWLEPLSLHALTLMSSHLAVSRPIVHSDLSGPFIGSLVSPELQVQLLLSTHELTSSQTLASWEILQNCFCFLSLYTRSLKHLGYLHLTCEPSEYFFFLWVISINYFPSHYIVYYHYCSGYLPRKSV